MKNISQLLFIVALFSTTPSFARSGDLDPTFGSGGKVLTDVRKFLDAISKIAIQPDGKIVAGGRSRPGGSDEFADWALARYETDGSLDLSFGNKGLVITGFGKQKGRISDLLVQPDNKILVTGWNRGTIRGANVGLARYEPQGGLDPSFGKGGLVLEPLGVQHSYSRSVELVSNGDIVIGGHTRNNLDGTTRKTYRPILMRFLGDGSVKKSFGNNGVLIAPLNPLVDSRLYEMILDSKSRLVGVGYLNSGNLRSAFAGRMKLDGRFDLDFKQASSPFPGVIQLELNRGQDVAWAVAETKEGDLIFGGTTFTGKKNEFLLMKVKESGELDMGFGNGGVVTTSIGFGNDQVTSVAIQSDAKIIAVGSCQDTVKPATNDIDFCAVRYERDGGIDTSFGNYSRLPGASVIDFGNPQDIARSVEIQSDGKIVIAGESINGAYGDFALARLTP